MPDRVLTALRRFGLPGRRLVTGVAVCALTAALVAACAGPHKPKSAAGPQAAPPAPSKSTAKTKTAPPAPPAVARIPTDRGPATSTPPPPLPEFTAGQFIGKGPDTLLGVFGEPRLIRRDTPAEIWQYARPGCVLLVFLYETDADPLRVWYM